MYIHIFSTALGAQNSPFIQRTVRMMASWTQQMGFPVLEVNSSDLAGKYGDLLIVFHVFPIIMGNYGDSPNMGLSKDFFMVMFFFQRFHKLFQQKKNRMICGSALRNGGVFCFFFKFVSTFLCKSRAVLELVLIPF